MTNLLGISDKDIFGKLAHSQDLQAPFGRKQEPRAHEFRATNLDDDLALMPVPSGRLWDLQQKLHTEWDLCWSCELAVESKWQSDQQRVQ